MSAEQSQPLPLGEEVAWTPVQRPTHEALRGSYVLARPFLPDADAQPLYAASHPPQGDLATWTYLPDGPYASVEQLRGTLEWAVSTQDAVYFALAPLPQERPLGMASYLRTTPEFGVIEIGHIWFGAGLKCTTAATEAIYLLLRNAFDQLGYRRVEWKCNALNAASCKAAERFGFTFEGIFRKHQVVKGHNRDTAWYAITDDQWPALRSGFQEWLAPENFDAQARQRHSLSELIARSRYAP